MKPAYRWLAGGVCVVLLMVLVGAVTAQSMEVRAYLPNVAGVAPIPLSVSWRLVETHCERHVAWTTIEIIADGGTGLYAYYRNFNTIPTYGPTHEKTLVEMERGGSCGSEACSPDPENYYPKIGRFTVFDGKDFQETRYWITYVDCSDVP